MHDVITDNGVPMTADQELALLRQQTRTAIEYFNRNEHVPHVPANRANAWCRVIWRELMTDKQNKEIAYGRWVVCPEENQ